MTDPSSPLVDLTSCDQEPIHIPGLIQPHGALFVLSGPDMIVTQMSANVERLIGWRPHELLGRPIDTLLDADQAEYLRSCLLAEQVEENPLYMFTLSLGPAGQPFDAIVHQIGELLVLELEPSTRGQPSTSLDAYRAVKVAVSMFQRIGGMQEFASSIAARVRALTGFDRVMIYRFEPDGTGVVIAESKRAELAPYLNLHYPASDIPQQARALYLRNWLRLIPDVGYHPVPMLAWAGSASAPLDMSYAVLRSVSPVHIEYLTNMGVTASMSISLIKGEQLWGLIACHHQSGPRYLAYDIRSACEFLGQVVSLQLSEKEAAEDASYTASIAATQAKLVEQMSLADDIVEGLTHAQPSLLDLFEAGGAAICVGERCVTLGASLPEAQVRQLIGWLDDRGQDDLYATAALPRDYPPAAQFAEVASGVLAVRLARARPDYLLWFLPEVIRTIEWGGNPEKPVEISDQGARLRPRQSFEIWKQTARHTARPWKDCELAAARDLRHIIIEHVVRRLEDLARLNAELERSTLDLDSLASIVSYDLREPLRGIHNYSHFLLEDYVEQLDGEGVERIQTLIRLTQRMDALIDSLVYYSRVGQADLAFADVDLGAKLAEVVEQLAPQIAASGAAILIPQALPTVRADSARVGEVLSNLIANAIKFNDKPSRWVEIGYRQLPAWRTDRQTGKRSNGISVYVFYVRDNGIGIAAQHQELIFRIFKRVHGRNEYGGGLGAGLTIAKKIVERHGGAIWVDSLPGTGATFFFTLAPGEVDRRALS